MLHILLDSSGAYLCLEHSLVCSHLESLLQRVDVTLRRGDKTLSASPRFWEAFEAGSSIATKIPGIQLRETGQKLIVGSLQ